MLCEKCGKCEATGFYEEAAGGAKTIVRLCTRCLLEKQKELFGGLNMFSSALPKQKSRCSKCGTDFSSVAKRLFLGCPDCYKAFGEHLPPLIKNIQNSTTHVGSAPGQATASGGGAESEIDVLTAQLKAAIKEERFEDAAAINRRIKYLMEGGL